MPLTGKGTRIHVAAASGGIAHRATLSYQASTATIASGTFVYVPFDTVEIDTDSYCHTGAVGSIVIPAGLAGDYIVEMYVQTLSADLPLDLSFSTPALGGRKYLTAGNTFPVAVGARPPQTLFVSKIVTLAVADTITLWVGTTTKLGSAVTITAAWISVAKLG